MALRKAYVVATHPEDNAVDLVMADNGQRMVGVQVQSKDASSRTGSVDLPHVPEKANKWDITKETGQDMIATVDTMNGQPIVTGFVYPQVNQILSKDPQRKSYRHQSDVSYSIDGEGNVQLNHPSGTYIRIGEAPDREETEGANADGNAKVDRNTGRKVNIRIGLAGNAVVLTMSPTGEVTLKMEQNLDIECVGATVKASDNILFDTPKAHFTGEVTSDGDMIAGDVSLQNHNNTGVIPGGGVSGPPERTEE